MSTNATLTQLEANLAREDDISIIAVGVGERVNEEVKKIASKESMAMHVNEFANLNKILVELEEKICNVTNEQGMDVCTSSNLS